MRMPLPALGLTVVVCISSSCPVLTGRLGAVNSEAVEGKPTGADVARVLAQTLMFPQRPAGVAGSRFSTGGGAGRR